MCSGDGTVTAVQRSIRQRAAFRLLLDGRIGVTR